MRIGVGAVLGITGGPATYARELLAALTSSTDDEYVVFTDRPDMVEGLAVEPRLVPLRRVHQQVTWDHARLPAMIGRSGVALYHGTKGVLPWRLSVPGVVTVHDLAVYERPETFAWPQRLHFRLFVPPSVRRARRVIADSEHAKRALVRRFGVPEAHVPVVPLGVRPELSAPASPEALASLRRRHDLGERLVLCVGTVQPRKRVERVIEAFGRARGRARGWQLVIAGRVRPGHQPIWIERPPEGVRWLGPLSEDDLRLLYAAGEIAMSASDYEGFGLTVCEAMAGGCAVIAVGATSIPEVVGDAGLLVERSDGELLGTALASLMDDEALRRDLAVRGRARAAQLTWTETARRTRLVYEEALA